MTSHAKAALSVLVLLSSITPARASFLPPDPFTNNARGTTGAAFLELPVGAQAEALAGSYSAAQGSPDDIYWNPAGLAGVSSPTLSASYDPLLASAYSSALSYASPFWGGTLGLGAYYDSQSPLQGYDSLANPTGSVTQYDMALAGGWARSFGNSSAGMDLKLFQQHLAGVNANGAAVDMGFEQKAAADLNNGPVDMGLMVRNLGAPVKLGTVSDALPLAVTVGGLWHCAPSLSFAIDMHFPVDQTPYPSFGAEWHLPAGDVSGALRVGYSLGQSQQSLGGLAGLTLGGGLELLKLRLDYAWIPMGDLGNTQRITMGYRF